jgi:hypothetical protein
MYICIYVYVCTSRGAFPQKFTLAAFQEKESLIRSPFSEICGVQHCSAIHLQMPHRHRANLCAAGTVARIPSDLTDIRRAAKTLYRARRLSVAD